MTRRPEHPASIARRPFRGALRRVVWAAAALFVLGAIAAGPLRAQDLDKRISDKQKELQRIKREMDEHRAKSRELQKQEKDMLSTLSAVEKEIELSRTFLRGLREQEDLLSQQVDSLKFEISRDGYRLEEQKRSLARRLRQLYERDPNYSWNVVLGSESIQDAMRRYKFLRIIAQRDADLVREFRDRKQSLEAETAAMTESLSEMAMVRQTREQETMRLQDNKARRQAMLDKVRGERAQHKKAIARLEKAQGEVKDLIGDLEKKRIENERKGLLSAGEFAQLKGKLPWPVDGKVQRSFGENRSPKYGTVTFNNGIDIKARSGAPIRAVASGTIEFVDWIDAYGKCIIINHGGGYYTLYAHVAGTFVSQGQSVSMGEVIAEVGDTGSLEGFECHFEIRQGKKALNPSGWLGKPGT